MSALSAFRSWRRSRPFWAGVFVMAGGAVIILLPLAPLPIMLEIGFAAVAGVVCGLVLIIGGLLFWFTPSNRVVISVITAAVSVFSLPASNLGGFIVGMMAGIIGSCLAFAWTPDKQATARGPKPPQEPPLPPVPRHFEEPSKPDFVPWYRREGVGAPHAWPAGEPAQKPGPAHRGYR